MSPNNVYPVPGGQVPTGLPKNHINALLIPLIVAVLLLIAAISFGFWAYLGREDYKNNSDKKAAAAVAAAEEILDGKKEAEFAEREKEPLKEYKGPATFGSLVIKYPKTWSAYVTESSRGATPLDGYLHPDVVSGVQSGTAYAVHFQVTSTAYDQELKKFESAAKQGTVSVSPITAPLVSNVAGVRITGEIENGKQGVTVLFPLRDKTLKITTESERFVGDFDTFILPNLTFSP